MKGCKEEKNRGRGKGAGEQTAGLLFTARRNGEGVGISLICAGERFFSTWVKGAEQRSLALASFSRGDHEGGVASQEKVLTHFFPALITDGKSRCSNSDSTRKKKRFRPKCRGEI